MTFFRNFAALLCGGLVLGALLAAGNPASAVSLTVTEIAKSFAPYSEVTTRSDSQFFYVESKGVPDHSMMVGITSWIEQVPLPQNYTGTNAWRFPLVPVPAANPLSAKDHFFRGAIAIAANGVPIFNPIKADGKTDTYLAGELDEFGGHAGRADDYHYHIAPTFLADKLGPAIPLAWALDGYPLYGYTEADGSAVSGLDAFNGHTDAQGRYHYHATKAYPYLNGGFHGTVVEANGQVEPQPRSEPLRSDSQLRLPRAQGAKVTGFRVNGPGDQTLEYTRGSQKGTIRTVIQPNGTVKFTYTDLDGTVRNETYTPGVRR